MAKKQKVKEVVRLVRTGESCVKAVQLGDGRLHYETDLGTVGIAARGAWYVIPVDRRGRTLAGAR
jgi:hypothetical protein